MPPVPPFAPVAVVFDLDGLLVDTEPAWERAEIRVVESFGRRWDPAVRPLLLGSGPVAAAQTLGAFFGIEDIAEVDRRMLAASLEEIGGGVVARPGAIALVAALADRVPLAVATNAERAVAEITLGATGLGARMRVVVTADDVAAPKPAPDPYLEAARRLGVDPARCVAFEDSPTGAAAAVAAGMWVVGCPSVAGVDLPAVDALVRSLADIDPELLLAGAARRDPGRPAGTSPGTRVP